MEMLPDRPAVVSVEATSLLAATVLSAALLASADDAVFAVASPLPHATNVVTANIPAPIRANNLLCLTPVSYTHLIPYNVTDSYNAENWSLSKTLEYAFDDYCIAEMAQKMGKKDIADEFYKRSQNYKNVYNPATSFMQPRDDKGVFIKDFKADDYTPHICESNGWQYFWSVQHDVDGLVNLVGGKNRFAEKLDSMFTYHPSEDDELPLFSTGMIGQYAHGNEPSHHVIYLFNSIGFNDRTQYYVAKVMNELYKNEPAGLCGNEDCGQMSAWYVFSAMGFYPVNPVSGRYEIGTPLFPEIKLHLANGKTFTVLAPNVNKENIYIQSIKVDGQPYDKTYLTHEQIMSGATVEFEMSNTPKAIGVIFEEKNP